MQETPFVCCREYPSFVVGTTLRLLQEMLPVCCRKYPSFAAGNTLRLLHKIPFVCGRKCPLFTLLLLWIYMLLPGPASHVKSIADALKYKTPVPRLRDTRGGSGRGYTIDYIYNQSCTERAGRNMNAPKAQTVGH